MRAADNFEVIRARMQELEYECKWATHKREQAARSEAPNDRLPGSGTGGVRASTRRMAGCAIPTSSAGHAPAGAKTDPKLTFDPDHLVGAGHLPARWLMRRFAKRISPRSSLAAGPSGAGAWSAFVRACGPDGPRTGRVGPAYWD